ncbi:MAG: asparagine synthase (glutamine-hydrolyzing) [Candidatus Omnitrophica bacterium]|nr:asparagine synthase (glutamine-hydrolyzing) [Candidatus Omnitrophota bacterium]
MCGIAGFIIKNPQINKGDAGAIIAEMCGTMRYRGPDDRGEYIRGFDGQHPGLGVGLGHNRLSIIDLTSAGHQPMTNEDSTIWLSYNGEIYNFLELRELLIKNGHRFRSRTDSEVVIHSYEEWGKDCLNKFNGMFAFALWDSKDELLMLARDRMGKKPIYYSAANYGIIFASEPKAILKFPRFEKEIDEASLRKYFLYEYVPSPRTIYKNINRVPAGNLLIWRNGSVAREKYWDISFNKKTAGDQTAALKDLLEDSVKKRLISDVPLGVFLSGGVDSSTITALTAGLLPSERINTFTIGFKDRSFDEAPYARAVSRLYRSEHHENILDPDAMLRAIPEIADFLDEPFADASIIPTYLLCKFARQRVTVALSGDGADELFAGYDTFPAHALARVYARIPLFLRKGVFDKIIHRLPVSFDNLSIDFKLKQFLKGAPYRPEIRNQIWLGSFSAAEQRNLLSEGLCEPEKTSGLYEDIDNVLMDCDARNYVDLIIYLYCKFYLQDDILTKVDRASMACSLETRAPFLDYRVVEFACGLPPREKLYGLRTKRVLKQLMRGLLPKEILRRPKKGFGIPVAKWIRGEAKEMVSDELSFAKIKREGILNPAYAQTLLDEHFRGVKDNRKQLWTILMFELWYSRWYKKAS